uniref:Uncharacterized protein n=1 Tax=Ixodes ricinus TaxID=34613 RepID=A0A131Y728_IXORI
MLHGHPYLVIKMHEKQRDQEGSSKPHTRLETVQVHANASQHKGKRHEWPPDENVGDADTESLKHQMEGNLLSMLRTIRELDRLANGSRRAPSPMVLGPSIEIDRVLVDRSRGGRPSWLRPTRRHEADELDEDEAEEGDLHRFNLLLRQALNQLQHSTRKPVS